MLTRICVITLYSIGITATLTTNSAQATFHEWKFAEIYSNASGTVQFIELADAAPGEVVLHGQSLTSTTNTFTFGADLPAGTPTADHRLLLATPGYFALKGVPQADYNLGINQFFNPLGDTLTYAGGLDTLSFASVQLPTDGKTALVRVTPTNGSAVTTALNSPTDVAGTTGVIPPWENQNNRLDINGNGSVQANDALQIISEILVHLPHDLPTPSVGDSPPPFFDATGDNKVDAQDALQVINFLLFHPQGSALPLAAPALAIAVPEPDGNVLALCAAGLATLWGAARRRNRSRG